MVQAMCECPDCEAVQKRAIRRQTSDPYEVEADRVADLVMRPTALPAAPPIQAIKRASDVAQPQKATADEDEEDTDEIEGDQIDAEFGLQAKAAPGGTGGSRPLPVAGSGGEPLPARQRSFLEPRFGRNFGSVRLHTGSAADASAKSIGALAYTQGNHIVFRADEYSPTSANGGWLLAHELTHVAQQGHAPVLGSQPQTVTPSSEGAVQRFADPLVPTRQAIDSAYAQSLTDDELNAAILATKSATEQENQSTPYADSLFANLGILESERSSRDNSSEMPRDAKLPPPTQQETDVEFEESEFDVEAEDWTAPEPASGIVRGDPVRLRPAPSESSTYQEVGINTELVVLSKQGSWSQVKLKDGRQGWIASQFVETKLPDPEARLHIVKKGESAQGIARHYYGAHSTEWGQDERYFVNVLYYTNENFPAQRGKDKGILRPPGKEDDWDATKVYFGSRIWIPGVTYALGLRGVVSSGSITYEVWQTIKNIFIGIAGFIAGLLVGAVESIVDVFVGLWDLVKMAWEIIKSLVTGEIISDIRKLWDDLSKLTIKDILAAGGDWLESKWFAKGGTWPRWYNRGWLVGYAIVEILMLVFSAGIASAVKWAGKTAKLASLLEKIPTIAKMVKKAEQLTGPTVDALRLGAKALSKAHHWAQTVLRIPFEIIKDTSAAALERLKGLSAWAKEKFRHLNPFAMKTVLGCASPCRIDIHEVEAYLKNLPATGAKLGAKIGGSAEKILASLPADKLNLSLIRKKLKTRPALRQLVEAAELTPADMEKIAAFAKVSDLGNPGESYRVFVRYLTSVVPAKTKGDINAFNKIAAALMNTDAAASEAAKIFITRQGSALKGSMFEGFAKLYLPELGGKEFGRVIFKNTALLNLEKAERRVDNFVRATGEIWEIKHSFGKVPLDQARDYKKLLGKLTPDGIEVKGVNYLFPTEAAAKANAHLKELNFGVNYVLGKEIKAL